MKLAASFFLSIKHWQLFLLTTIVGLAYAISVISQPAFLERSSVRLIVMNGLNLLIMLGWMWTAGTFLQSKLQPSLRLNIRIFYFALVVPFLSLLPDLMEASGRFPGVHAASVVVGVVGFFCVLYDIGFVAESLWRAEKGTVPSSFGAVAGNFILIWAFPIGVWFIQPKINRLYAERTDGPPDNIHFA